MYDRTSVCVSWNLAYAKPAAHRSLRNRRRLWALLGALDPNVALLLVCRPTDLNMLAPDWMTEEYTTVGDRRSVRGRRRGSVLGRYAGGHRRMGGEHDVVEVRVGVRLVQGALWVVGAAQMNCGVRSRRGRAGGVQLDVEAGEQDVHASFKFGGSVVVGQDGREAAKSRELAYR